MPIGAQRWALAAIVVLLLVSSFTTLGNATPTASNTLAVNVTMAGGLNPPAGVSVTLTAAGTGVSCSAMTSGSPFVLFDAATGCTLVPGWYTVSVAPQIDSQSELAILPSATAAPDTFYASQATLNTAGPETYTGLSQLVLNQTVTGWVNETAGGHPSSATVEVLDPAVPGFVLASGPASGGFFTLNHVPAGTWTLYTSGQVSGSNYPSYNYTSISVTDTHYGVHWQNLTLGEYIVQGEVVPNDHFFFYNQTNLTLWDTATGQTYSFVNPSVPYQQGSANYFTVGDFNSLTGVGSANRQFLLFVAPQGEGTDWEYVNANPSTEGISAPTTFHVPDLSVTPATTVATTITYAGNFSAVNVTSKVTLSTDSVLPHLPNANLGDLYAQVAMDFGTPGQVNATAGDWTNFVNWLNASGPVYPANQMDLKTNGSNFLENARYQWTQGAAPTNTNFNSGQSYWYQTSEEYNLTKTHLASIGYPSYNATLGFTYPAPGQTATYTVTLPRDYTLAAGNPVPNGTAILPGPGGNYSTFTLDAFHSPWGNLNGTAYLRIVQEKNVTAVVNVNSPNFAFSNKTNVLNQSHDNYQVLVGLNQNVSFSSIDSVLPAGFNATSYMWNFGDGNSATTYRDNTTAWHYYATAGQQNASLTLRANGGQTNTQDFTVFVNDLAPTPVITTNNTHVPTQTSGNTSWLYLNWSQGIQLNATHSTDKIASSVSSPAGTLSDAIWNISAGPTYYTQNFSIGAKAASVFANVSYEFQGAGPYVSSTDLSEPGLSGTFVVHGWVYRVVLTLYSSGGLYSRSTLWAFVNDTEAPVAIGAVQGGPHFNPSSGFGLNQTSEVALRNETCNVELNQWSYAPNNATLSTWSWQVYNPSNWSINPHRFFNSTGGKYSEPDLWVKVPISSLGSSTSSTQYVFRLNVTDQNGFNSSKSYDFSCELNTQYSPILQALNTTVQGTTTLTDQSKYTLQVNITNAGGNASVANTTTVAFYYQTPSGADRTAITGSLSWYYYVDNVISTQPNSTQTVNIKWNNTYRAEISFSPGSGVSGQYEICANTSSPNEFAGSYSTHANVYCTTVTFQETIWQQYEVAIIVAVVAAVILIVVFFVWRARTSGGSKKGGAAKKGKAKDEEDEDEEEEDDRASKSKASGKGKDEDDDE